jgi:hypothetical protein
MATQQSATTPVDLPRRSASATLRLDDPGRTEFIPFGAECKR